ncbi:MAG: protein translocase subunit SecF [Dehalococcoidales bacterium]|nr:protein translocase subunit SecF [Dehalococcoidales bacterium]MDD5121870.1 protein translocase subunit SecF [Dehalococcoidales bacterium]MDD5498929.1 protein translocase subunit SecF [Dehalococcoidales bacterium]
MIDIVGKRFKLFAFTAIVMLICIITLATSGLKMGIDFSSGSLLTLSFEEEVALNDIKQELSTLGYDNAIVQVTGDGDFLIRTLTLEAEEKASLETSLESRFGELEELSFENVDPVIARQTARNAAIAVAAAAVGIMLYITWAFRRMPKPFHYGTCAIAALVHDLLIVIGIFAVLSIPMGLEVNLMFITGVLAVLGYSVNDTVVIFDRIRENRLNNPTADLAITINRSLVETLTRSVNTGITTLVVILALLMFIGSTILNFAIIMLIGVLVGTYSSIFVASTLLIVWDKKEWKRFIPWLNRGEAKV